MTKLQSVLHAFTHQGALTCRDASDLTGMTYHRTAAHIYWLIQYGKLKATDRRMDNGKVGTGRNWQTVYEPIPQSARTADNS